MKNRQQALDLLDQIIEYATTQDSRRKSQAIADHQAEKTVGESWEIYHLRLLKKLLGGGE